jgi:hypothetical protein
MYIMYLIELLLHIFLVPSKGYRDESSTMASQSCPLHPGTLAGSGADDIVHTQEKLEEY